MTLATDLVRQGVWIIGGDGWAYDIGFGGLDQVLSSGRNVNILVLDTEVYSNTGGQASKATPARRRREVRRRRQGDRQEGPGRDRPLLRQRLRRPDQPRRQRRPVDQGAARGRGLGRPVARHRLCDLHRARHRHVDLDEPPEGRRKSGYWPLYRFQPSEVADGTPFKLDSASRRLPIADFVAAETRFAILQRTDPDRAATLAELAQADADERWRYYAQLAGIQRSVPHVGHAEPEAAPRTRRRRRRLPPRPTGREASRDRRPAHHLSRAGPALAARRSSSPYTGELATARRMERAGAAAIVLPSLFEEEILNEELQLTRALEAGTNQFAEALDYFPTIDSIPSPSDRYVELIAPSSASSTSRSSRASTPRPRAAGSATRAQIQEAGADALELNLYHLVADPRTTAADGERTDLDLVRAVCPS